MVYVYLLVTLGLVSLPKKTTTTSVYAILTTPAGFDTITCRHYQRQ